MEYLLCWLPDTDINRIRPVLAIDQLILLANQREPNALAKMVRLNWMIADVRKSGIIKPIFVRDDTFDVIVGDTRIMAAQLAGISQVPVMAYLQDPQGTVCQTHDDILRLSGFDTDAKIHWTPCETDILRDPPEWIDIGDHRTRHHGHDECLRLAAIEDYLRKKPQWLDRDWLLEPKDWGDIFN